MKNNLIYNVLSCSFRKSKHPVESVPAELAATEVIDEVNMLSQSHS